MAFLLLLSDVSKLQICVFVNVPGFVQRQMDTAGEEDKGRERKLQKRVKRERKEQTKLGKEMVWERKEREVERRVKRVKMGIGREDETERNKERQESHGSICVLLPTEGTVQERESERERGERGREAGGRKEGKKTKRKNAQKKESVKENRQILCVRERGEIDRDKQTGRHKVRQREMETEVDGEKE